MVVTVVAHCSAVALGTGVIESLDKQNFIILTKTIPLVINCKKKEKKSHYLSFANHDKHKI